MYINITVILEFSRCDWASWEGETRVQQPTPYRCWVEVTAMS